MPLSVGMRVPASAVSATLVGEALVHGYDIAKAERSPWPIDPEHALLTMDGLEPVMSYNRIGPVIPSLTGNVLVWGRRPWLAICLGRLFHTCGAPTPAVTSKRPNNADGFQQSTADAAWTTRYESGLDQQS